MTIKLPADVEANLQDAYAVLETPYNWRAVTSYFKPEAPPRDSTSNVHVVPFIGDRVVLLHAKESGWGPSGGTLLKDETIETTIARELGEELGGEAMRFELFGQWDSVTTAETPYRPWLPHPRFAIALGWADIIITGSSKGDGGIEMESILEVVILPVQQAADRLQEKGKPHLAALYRLASEIRRASKQAAA